MRVKAVFFDIDGTLVDSNDFHVSAWLAAFEREGFSFDRAMIHSQIGKGADMLIPSLVPDANSATGERLAQFHGEIFKQKFLDRVKPFPSAHDLLTRVHESGRGVLLASSASGEELEHYLRLLDARALVKASTSADDVEQTKPAGDIFAAALKKVAPLAANQVIVVGDTPYDVEAARRCGIAAVAVRSGKFPEGSLREPGPVAVYDDVATLLRGFEGSPLAQ